MSPVFELPSAPAPATGVTGLTAQPSVTPDGFHADVTLVARIPASAPTAVTPIDDTHLALLTTRAQGGQNLPGWTLQEVELPSGRVTRSVSGPDDSPVGVAITPTSIYVTVGLTARPSAATNRVIRVRRSDFAIGCQTSDPSMTGALSIVSAADVVWATQLDGSLLRFADGGCMSTHVPVDMPPRASGPYGLASDGHQLVMTTSWPTSDTLPAADSPWEGQLTILDGADGHLVSTVPLTAAHLYAGTNAVAASDGVVLAADEEPRQIHVITATGVTTVAGPSRVQALTNGVSIAADASGCVVLRAGIAGACPNFLRGEGVIGSGGDTAILVPDTSGEQVEILVVRVSHN